MEPTIHSTATATTSIALPKKVDIIWNITKVCSWDCAVCCVDADHVSRKGDRIIISTDSLKTERSIQFNATEGSIFDQAVQWNQKAGLELTLEQKLEVLNNLSGFDVKLDISGGDPLSATENTIILRESSARFGKDKITLTATGTGLSKCNVEEIASLIGELNFTFDSNDHQGKVSRPDNYASGNLKKASRFAEIGVKTRAELPMTIHNIDEQMLEQIYMSLNLHGIGKLLLMRLFPVGRGVHRIADTPSAEQYRKAISFLRSMEAKYGSPVIKLQCALNHFDNSSLPSNPCDVFHESFGLMSNGTLLASPWAINTSGKPIDDSWVLGNLSTTSLTEILSSPKAQIFAKRANENFGHCKIFSFIYSKNENSFDKIFDTADPFPPQ